MVWEMNWDNIRSIEGGSFLCPGQPSLDNKRGGKRHHNDNKDNDDNDNNNNDDDEMKSSDNIEALQRQAQAFAQSPFSQVLMTAFMMYMSGNSIQVIIY